MEHGHFIGEPSCSWLPRGHGEKTRLLLNSPLVYVDAKGKQWRAPGGMTTDLSSVPALIPTLVRLSMADKLQSAAAAIIHDHLYQTGETTRAEADRLYRECLMATGSSRFGSWLQWRGLTAGGWVSWNRHARRRDWEAETPTLTGGP